MCVCKLHTYISTCLPVHIYMYIDSVDRKKIYIYIHTYSIYTYVCICISQARFTLF